MELSSLLSSNTEDISGLMARMGSFEDRLKKATASPSSQPADLKTLANDFQEFKTLVWQVLSKLKAQTDLLSLGQDRHETFLRRKILLFHGIPETKDEDLQKVILSVLTDQMQLPDLTLNDLQSCHRLGSSSTKPRPVLVRFRDLVHRRLAWDTKTSLKDTGIVLSEFLTKSRHDVFMAARKHFGVRNCWSSDGKIIILLPDKSRKKIEVISELRSLTAFYPAVKDSKPAAKSPDVAASGGKTEQTKPTEPTKQPTKPSSSVPSRNLRVRP